MFFLTHGVELNRQRLKSRNFVIFQDNQTIYMDRDYNCKVSSINSKWLLKICKIRLDYFFCLTL